MPTRIDPPRPSPTSRLLASLVVATVVAGCSTSPSAQPGPGSTTVPGQSANAALSFDPNSVDTSKFDPGALAEAVVMAGSDGARQHAVIAALASIGLGVYTPDGTPIIAGAERSATDFIVYDFEIVGLAGGIADGDEVYLDDIAAELSTVNVAAGADAFDPADFASAVTQATAAAMADPGNAKGRALRLARELGIRRPSPVDLSLAPTAAPIVLDPLAGFLVAADVSLPQILGADPPQAASIGQLASVGDAAALVAAANPCSQFQRNTGASWFAGMSVPGNRAQNASYSRALQARLVGGTVKLGSSHKAAWHHLHKGAPADSKAYLIGLQVRAPMPPAITCGPIRYSGRQPVGGGAIVGADVTWTHPEMDHHGTIVCQAECLKTDASGIARLVVTPRQEAPPGGIGPEITKSIPVTAEVNLFQALGLDLIGLLNLPPDMRMFARKEMRTDVSWHRSYEVQVVVDSQLYVKKVPAYEYPNHMGTATLTGVIDAATIHPPGARATEPPTFHMLTTISDQGTGAGCYTAASGAEGSVTIKQKTNEIDFAVIDAVIYPPEEFKLYLDVGPSDDSRDDTYRLIQCNRGKIVFDQSSPGANLWETIIFRGYPRGLSFSGVSMTGSGPSTTTSPNIWNWRATAQDWEGNRDFVAAVWETPQGCGGYCDERKSWLHLHVLVHPLPDP